VAGTTQHYSPSLRKGLEKLVKESRRADSNRLPLLQLRVMIQALQGVARACKFRISKPLSLLGLPCVAPYCVPGGIRVVSGELLFGLYSEEGTSSCRAIAYEGLRSVRGLAV
jgi:hypothetical protein